MGRSPEAADADVAPTALTEEPRADRPGAQARRSAPTAPPPAPAAAPEAAAGDLAPRVRAPRRHGGDGGPEEGARPRAGRPQALLGHRRPVAPPRLPRLGGPGQPAPVPGRLRALPEGREAPGRPPAPRALPRPDAVRERRRDGARQAVHRPELGLPRPPHRGRAAVHSRPRAGARPLGARALQDRPPAHPPPLARPRLHPGGERGALRPLGRPP